MRLALIGYGRMNQAVGRCAVDRGHEISTIIAAAENRGGAALTAQRLAGVEVAIESTGAVAAPEHLIALARLRIPTVCATTGWFESLPDVGAAVMQHGGALLYSANFSIGAQIFLRVAEDLARRFSRQAEFDGYVTETHHSTKRDAPSGTARQLAAALARGDEGRSWPITSIRGGHDPGTHEVVLDAAYETIRLRHVARSREVFAAGTVAAAEWLTGRTGVFTFDQMLFGGDA